jgi:asparagine synthetase B (glutamine-hydrolysing)
VTSPSSLEIATGIAFGNSPGMAPLWPAFPSGETPLTALERACLPALEHGPCLVSFSGGRDSSLVLAAATRAARRHGLPLPVPVTNRFAGVPHADESTWQELVIAHLGLTEWLRLDWTDELEVLGEFATSALLRHGLLWPFNAHFHSPLLHRARGGSLLTGIGGDEALGSSRWARSFAVLSGAERPEPRDLPRVALLAAPRSIRRAIMVRRAPEPFPWLRPAAARAVTRAWAADQASEPAGLHMRLERLQTRRSLGMGLTSLELLAEDAEATIAHPLLDPCFLAALAAAGGSRGWADRTTAMRALFDGVLPSRLVSRSSKARFEGAFWGARSRSFARTWTGEVADPEVVDPRALRRVWSQDEPDAHTFLLMQAAWLESQRSTRLYVRPVPGAVSRA